MLRIRPSAATGDTPWTNAVPGIPCQGFTEDTQYLLELGQPGYDLYIDDVALPRLAPSNFCWTPSFYAGRVRADVFIGETLVQHYWLDVGPSPSKSGQQAFDEMVEEIRSFDETLLGGTSSATGAFGREGQAGKFEHDVALSRLRTYGPAFLDAIEAIVRSPHRSISADTHVVPLTRVRRLHPSALRDRRLLAIASGGVHDPEALDSIQIMHQTSTPTFDTPANRSMLAILKRFQATVSRLEQLVQQCALGNDAEEQWARQPRRLRDLGQLLERARGLSLTQLFREVTAGTASAAGLTQIAAQPAYGRAYRLGCRALATSIQGDNGDDQLHIPPSWGIYETWCYLNLIRITAEATSRSAVEAAPRAVAAERAVRFELDASSSLEVLFQARFPALHPSADRVGWSISRERYPDIVLVHSVGDRHRALVLDAKWRSKRQNVLEAMESAHIYHDALRVASRAPERCVLLLPGEPCVPTLGDPAFLSEHGVGAISRVSVGQDGIATARALVGQWLRATPPCTTEP